MYGANYSGFAFHPKAIRMVGPVHFTVFFGRSAELCGPPCYGDVRRGRDAHRQAGQNRRRHPCWVTVFPIGRPILIPCAVRLAAIAGCRAHNARYPVQPSAIGTLPPSQHFGWLLRHLSPTTPRPAPKNKKRRVSRETRRPFPATRLTIKPSSSPARGTFRSRADSVPVRPPAPPAPTHPFQARSHSPRSAVPPARSARSAASRRPCRATR